jgi:EAL domain-containing protein (putative c-di-GMP-specific phosphodiesterase class I)
MQGYLFSKPVAIDAFLGTVATQRENHPSLSSA